MIHKVAIEHVIGYRLVKDT